MSFLTPLFLAGGLAILGPILFHLVRRSTRERTRFGSLMFLRPTPPRLTRRSRIEHWLLLVLRAAALLVLAMAFARPFLKSLAAEKSLPSATRRVVVLIDTSASMSRGGMWSKAAKEAVDRVEDAGPAAEVAIASFDRTVVSRLSFDDWRKTPPEQRIATARERIGALAATSSGTYLAPALSTAAEWLADQSTAADSAMMREIVVISDLQEGSHADAIQGFDWPKGVRVRLAPIAPDEPGNAGLQLMAEAPADRSGKDEASVRIRVSNTVDSRAESFQLGWAGAQATGFAGKGVDVYVPPGQNRVVGLPWPAGSTSGKIRLQGDAAAFDNDLAVAAPQPIKATVAHFGRSVEEAPRGPLFFLQRALAPDGTVSVEIESSPPDSADATPGDAALAIVTESLKETAAKSLGDWLANGGRAVVVLREAAMADTLGRLIGQPAPAVTEKSVASYAILGQISFDTPLFQPFADPRFSDFSKIRFWKHRTLEVSGLKDATVIASFDDGDPAIVDIRCGKGLATVFTSGWHAEDSQLALSSKFPALLASFLEMTGKVTPPPAQLLVGDPPPPDAPSAVTEKPGLFSGGGRTTAVVLDPMESQTAPLAPETLERLGVPLISASATPEKEQPKGPDSSLAGATEAEARQKLWRWLILAALGLLIMESLLAGRTASGPAGTGDAAEA